MLTRTLARTATRAALLAAGLTVSAQSAHAVNVSPAMLYIDSRTREGTVTLFNGGQTPEEIDLGFQYGYHVAGDSGAVRLVLSETAPAGAPSAVTWLRAYPRRLVLAPGETQVVRIIVRPPAGLADGEYWARLVVNAVPQAAAVEQTRGQATMRLRIGTRVVGAVQYRVGHPTTSLAVEQASASRTGDRVDLSLALVRGGNAAWIGRLRAKLLAADGTVLGEHTEPLTVYNGIRWRFSLPAGGRAAQVAAVEYTLDTRRDDLPAGTALPAAAVSGRVNLSEGAANAAHGR